MSVLISIKPKYCELIANGKKTVEVRKTMPRLETPFKCYIYCTKDNNSVQTNNNLWITDTKGFNWLGNGKVIGEFVCDGIYEFRYNKGGFLVNGDISTTIDALAQSRLTDVEFREYAGEQSVYGWRISDLVIYEKPKELWKFNRICQHKESCVDCIYSLNEARFCYDESVGCDRWLKRPPRSWCYVEEEQE